LPRRFSTGHDAQTIAASSAASLLVGGSKRNGVSGAADEAFLGYSGPVAQPAVIVDRDATSHDHIVVLDGATWADYERVLEIRGDRSEPRLAYLEGRLELMNPSKSHESIGGMIGRLLEAWCFENEVDVSPFGSWTLERKEAARAVEPDECYVVGDRPDAERPDLAIEVIWTSGGVGKLDIYKELGVQEVWVWKAGTLTAYVLRDAQFERRERSQLFPDVDLELLNRFVRVQPMTKAVRDYRAALRVAG
jgi:Uma2 family endonuclease